MAVDPQVGSSDRDAETMEELLGDRSAGVLPLRDASGGGTDVAVGDRVVAAVSNPKVPTVASAAAQPLRDQREEEPLPQPAEGQVRPSLRDQMRQRGSNRRLFIVPATACVCAHHGLRQGAGSHLLIY
jgi:hypothetical protein